MKLFGKLSEKRIWYIIRKASLTVLQRNIRPHEIRHYFANKLFEDGADIMSIKDYLGHNDLATTQIYLHRSEKESLANIEKVLNKN